MSWEDTGRYKGSCWGPNITDATLAVYKTGSGTCSSRLPMIRYPNFVDVTCDVPIENFQVTVGNETDEGSLKRIGLQEYLKNIGDYVRTKSGVRVPSMWCEAKDAAVLTLAQFCILPLAEGTVEFNVQLYNYQSGVTSPAVLVLVCSQKGTSAQTVTNGTTALFFNTAGKAANYVAERLKDERKRLGKKLDAPMDKDEGERNCLFIFQIPLKVKRPTPKYKGGYGGKKKGSGGKKKASDSECDEEEVEEDEDDSKDVTVDQALDSMSPQMMELCSQELVCQSSMFEQLECSLDATESRPSAVTQAWRKLKAGLKPRGIERAMLSVGKSHGPFEGVKDFTIERDTRFPIRCTFQYYMVTDSQTIPEAVWTEMKESIDRVYSRGTAKGSLVTEINTGRTTEWDAAGQHTPAEFTKSLPAAEAAKPMFPGM